MFAFRRMKSEVSFWWYIVSHSYLTFHVMNFINCFFPFVMYKFKKSRERDVRTLDYVCHEYVLAIKRWHATETRVTRIYRCVKMCRLVARIRLRLSARHFGIIPWTLRARVCEHTLKTCKTPFCNQASSSVSPGIVVNVKRFKSSHRNA